MWQQPGHNCSVVQAGLNTREGAETAKNRRSRSFEIVGGFVVLAAIGLLIWFILSNSGVSETIVAPETVAPETPVANQEAEVAQEPTEAAETEEPTVVPATPDAETPDAGDGAAQDEVGEEATPTATPSDGAGDDAAPNDSVSAAGPFGDSEPTLVTTDLGSGSSEFSAVTLNEAENVLIIVDDEGSFFEFELNNDGSPVEPPRRTLRVALGAGDIEGVAWLADQTYAIAHEDDGRLTIVDLTNAETVITTQQLLRIVDTTIREDDGNGLEGVAYIQGGDGLPGDFEFAAIKEAPPTLVLIGADGELVSAPLQLPVTDASDIAFRNGEFLVVSDESRSVLRFTLTDELVPVISESLDLGWPDGLFAQAEGVLWADDGRLYVVGENPGPARYSFGLWPQ